jgi:hypothetical protein
MIKLIKSDAYGSIQLAFLFCVLICAKSTEWLPDYSGRITIIAVCFGFASIACYAINVTHTIPERNHY